MLNEDLRYPVGIHADPIVFCKQIPVGDRAGDAINFHIRGQGGITTIRPKPAPLPSLGILLNGFGGR